MDSSSGNTCQNSCFPCLDSNRFQKKHTLIVKQLTIFAHMYNNGIFERMRTLTKQLVHNSLLVIGYAGFTGVLVVAPNATQAYGSILIKTLEALDISEKERIYRNLRRQGLVQIDRVDNKNYRLTITPAGAHRLAKELLDEITVPPMKKWDGKWRLVCYDIPISKNQERFEFTRHLNRMGFTLVQKSMWAHPHSCIEQIEAITDSLAIKRFVTILEATKFDKYTTKKLIKRYQNIIHI